MLKITAIGNLTNDVELKMNETTGKPYAILRIASDRRYKDSQIQITQAAPQAGSIDEDVLGFLASLQEGDDTD